MNDLISINRASTMYIGMKTMTLISEQTACAINEPIGIVIVIRSVKTEYGEYQALVCAF